MNDKRYARWLVSNLWAATAVLTGCVSDTESTAEATKTDPTAQKDESAGLDVTYEESTTEFSYDDIVTLWRTCKQELDEVFTDPVASCINYNLLVLNDLYDASTNPKWGLEKELYGFLGIRPRGGDSKNQCAQIELRVPKGLATRLSDDFVPTGFRNRTLCQNATDEDDACVIVEEQDDMFIWKTQDSATTNKCDALLGVPASASTE